jgi:hypothetical protein
MWTSLLSQGEEFFCADRAKIVCIYTGTTKYCKTCLYQTSLQQTFVLRIARCLVYTINLTKFGLYTVFVLSGFGLDWFHCSMDHNTILMFCWFETVKK